MKFTSHHAQCIALMLLSLLHNQTSHALPRQKKDDGIKFNTNSFARRTGSISETTRGSISHLHTTSSLTSLHDEFPCESGGTGKEYTGEFVSDSKMRVVNPEKECCRADVNTISQTS